MLKLIIFRRHGTSNAVHVISFKILSKKVADLCTFGSSSPWLSSSTGPKIPTVDFHHRWKGISFLL